MMVRNYLETLGIQLMDRLKRLAVQRSTAKVILMKSLTNALLKLVASMTGERWHKCPQLLTTVLNGISREGQEDETNEAAPASVFMAKLDSDAAEAELQRNITKDDFLEMEVLGQFNLGFIIAKLRDDLFVVDQHASDEKYNFERLQRETKLQQQTLVVPRRLDLTAVNEALLIEKIHVFQEVGFDFVVDMEQSATNRVRLSKIPYSKSVQLGEDDIQEMLFLLSDQPDLRCRPSRLSSMFASRACRSSIMIGTALTKRTMQQILQHMNQTEQPWNCPHGRPTMRHLASVSDLLTHS
eukprot:m.79081 g.79081  ORF g.79081 m.79081 type:complete len:297 (+) comp12557_c0_seq1:1569-2459(+)